MKGLIEYFADSLYGIVVLAMLITVLGVVALISIPVDILPSFNTPAVQVLTYFQGMPAASVERTITNRIERWVNQAPGMSRIESRSLTGV
ncbi:MAG: efflux RND transporter permease subunit, partial [Gemmataceae bacterium]